MPAAAIIPDRAEFIDALQALQRGRLLVQVHESRGGCVLDGAVVYTAHRPLIDYRLVDEVDNPQGFPNVRYFRLSPSGREFARRACAAWRARPLLERLAVRLTG